MLKNELGEIVAHVNRTIYGVQLQICQSRHAPFVILNNTTLNEKFDVLPDLAPAPKDYPSLDYWAIGRGGHYNYKGGDGADLTGSYYHEADHAALYEHLPFVLRPIDNDLTVAERAKYGLRVIKTYHGKQYIGYYLKRLPPVTTSPKLLKVTTVDGVQTVTDFVPSASDLSPVPVLPTNSGVTDLTGSSLTTSENIRCELNQQEIDEVVNACIIIYGNAAYAAISEIALVQGKDKVTASTDFEGTAFNYTEVIGAQCNSLYCAEPDNIRSSRQFDITFDIGVSDSLGISSK